MPSRRRPRRLPLWHPTFCLNLAPLIGFFMRNGPSGFGYNSTAEQVANGLDLTGKTYLITGVNAGLGYETMRVLASRGATIVGLARTVEKATQAAAKAGVPEGKFYPIACELSEPSVVRMAVREVVACRAGPLDAIIANAAIMALPKRETKHGVELQYLTNHVGHFILVNGIVKQLKLDGRVVILSSMAESMAYKKNGINFDDMTGEKEYSPWGAYGQSKLANLLFARELSKRLPEGQVCNSVHPGVAATELSRHMDQGPISKFIFGTIGPMIALKSVGACAATQTYLAVHPDAKGITGKYWASCNVSTPSPHGQDDELAARMWKETEALVNSLTD